MTGGAALILTYHHVVDAPTDHRYLCVSPQHLAEHLEVLRDELTPLPLSELATRLRTGDIPPGSVAVTFDDGCVNHLETAKPLLESCDVPATMFVTTELAAAGTEYWWDELEGLLLRPGVVPSRLELKLGGRHLSYDLGESATYTRQAFDSLSSWKAWEEPPTRRHSLCVLLEPWLKSMSEEERTATMEGLRDWAGAKRSPDHSRARLSEAQIKALSSSRLIDVGGHGITHASLPSLPRETQRREIDGCRASLGEILAEPARSFAYPFGEHTDATVELVHDAGFECACTTAAGLVTAEADPLELPRYAVVDMDGSRFREWIRETVLRDGPVDGRRRDTRCPSA
jgi:peptidoglycan/xylan/chitin deacetylase (PgdA/CDA1 family)